MTEEDKPYTGQEGEINDKVVLDLAWEQEICIIGPWNLFLSVTNNEYPAESSFICYIQLASSSLALIYFMNCAIAK